MFETKVFKVIDKEALSDTSGTSRASASTSRGLFSNHSTASASNTVRTNQIQNVTFESIDDPDDHKRIKFVNQDFETPVGKTTAVYFMNDEPIAYLPSKKAECTPLNWLRTENQQSITVCIFVFLICCIPFVGSLVFLGNLGKGYKHYVNGSFKEDNTPRIVAVIGLVLLSFLPIFQAFTFFAIMNIVLSAAYVYFVYKAEGKIYDGIVSIKKQAAEALSSVRDKM